MHLARERRVLAHRPALGAAVGRAVDPRGRLPAPREREERDDRRQVVLLGEHRRIRQVHVEREVL